MASPRLLDPLFVPPEIWIKIWNNLLPAQAIGITDDTEDNLWHWINLRGAPEDAPPVMVRPDLPYPTGATFHCTEIIRTYRATSTQKESEIRGIRRIHKASRDAAKRYQRSFLRVINGEGTNGVWFDGKVDILIFKTLLAIEALHEAKFLDLPLRQPEFDAFVTAHIEVTKIGIAVKIREGSITGIRNLRLLATFTNLKELYVVWESTVVESLNLGPTDELVAYEAEKAQHIAYIHDRLTEVMGKSGHTFELPKIFLLSEREFEEMVESYPRKEIEDDEDEEIPDMGEFEEAPPSSPVVKLETCRQQNRLLRVRNQYSEGKY